MAMVGASLNPVEQPRSLSTPARGLSIAVGALNIGDIALHVAIDDVEPLRVTGNVVVILAAAALLFWPRLRHLLTPVIAAGINLALNLVFIALEGIGPLGAILIAATTLLLIAITLTLRRQRA